MKTEAKEWLEKAREDLDVAEYNLKGNKLSAAAFYFQQAAEKALKALQIEKLNRFERTHDLVILAKSLDTPKEIIEICESVTIYYVITRYPNSKQEYTKKDIMNAGNGSKKVIRWIEEMLK